MRIMRDTPVSRLEVLRMLNFEEELKKFKPCLEVEEIEEAVYQEDLTDVTDLIKEVMQNK